MAVLLVPGHFPTCRRQWAAGEDAAPSSGAALVGATRAVTTQHSHGFCSCAPRQYLLTAERKVCFLVVLPSSLLCRRGQWAAAAVEDTVGSSGEALAGASDAETEDEAAPGARAPGARWNGAIAAAAPARPVRA